MKRLLFLLLIPFFFGKKLQAQETRIDSSHVVPVITNIEHFDPLKYPLKAIRKKIEGAVKVEIEVDSTGKYVSHNFLSSPGEVLNDAVAPFLPGLEFLPGEKNGRKVSDLATIEIIFSIERRVPIRTEIAFRFTKR